ncbi:MAG: hypothetical protein BWX73_03526 [Lentisphaerae bacterium ADurb.Bin082]|nr:MAG: hypothetical protein BWX73_03526 [Lentisphaerae bacterium ADurb.Bin082]
MDYHFTSKNCRIEGGQLQYTEGINSPAGVFFGKRKAVFQLDDELKTDSWGVSIWAKPLGWKPHCENFVFFLALTSQREKNDDLPVDLIVSKFCKQTSLAFNLRLPEGQNFYHDIALWETDSWHHLAVTFEQGTYKYYLDGELTGEKNAIKAVKWENLIIGTPYNSWSYIGEEKTAIGDVTLHSAAPSAEQIREKYRAGRQRIREQENEYGNKAQAEYSFDSDLPLNIKVAGKIAKAKGIIGQGLSADGGNLTVATKDLLGDAKRGTVTMWVCPQWTPTTDECYFFCMLHAGAKRILLYKPHQKAVVCLLYQDTASKEQKQVEYEVLSWRKDEWRHLAFSWGQGLYTLYIDGKVCGTINEVPDMKFDNFMLGQALPEWNGLGSASTLYDEIKLYNRTLPAKEIFEHYSQHAPTHSQTLQHAAPETPNLATAANKCIIIASSFENYQQNYTDNLIDGDPTTFWRSKEAGEKLFLELRWPFPRKIDQLFLRGLTPTPEQIRLESYLLATDSWIAVKEFQPEEVQDGPFIFPVQNTTRLRLHLIPPKNQKTAASELEAYGPKQAGTGLSEPYWDAWYIWYPEPDKVHKAAQPRYFRKTFQLDEIPVSAVIQARSNDYYKIFVNGTEVDSGSVEIRPQQVTKLLKIGDNVIAAEADLGRNPGHWGWGEFIAELSLNYHDKTIKIGTGEDWKSSKNTGAGWTEQGFDDSAWLKPFCYLRPPEGPWGKIDYYSSSICEQADSDGKTPVHQAKPGEVIKISFSFTPRHRLNQNYDFLLEAGSDIPGIRGERHLFTSMYMDAPETENCTETITVMAELILPPWTPSGRQPVYLSAAGQKNGLALTINGSEKIKIAEIEVTGREVPDQGVTNAQIGYPNGQAAFILDNQVTTPLFWRYMILSDPERLYMTERYSDIKIHQFLLYGRLIDAAGSTNWSERFAELDRNIRTLLGVNPQALIVVLWLLNPTQQWLQENPDEMLITAFGKKEGVSFASEKYRRECLAFTKAVVEYLQQQPYWKQIIGFHPWICGMPDCVTGGVEGNLWQTDRSKITVGDFNPQAITMFRAFLRKRYENDIAKLREAWRKPDISFDTVMPDIKELTAPAADGGVFRDPAAGKMPFDYMDFIPTMLSSLLVEMCRLTKEMTGYTRINFVHYGFVVVQIQSYNLPGSIFNNNNFDLSELLRDPAIDGYIGAPSYSARLPGTPCLTYFPWTSFRLHGRMYLPDDDTRYYHCGTRNYGHNHSIRESRAITLRNLGADITRNFGSWFSDMSQGKGALAVSWTGEREVAEMLGEMNRLYQKAQQVGYRSAAEIAVIFSADSPRYLDIFHGPTLANNLIEWMFYPEFFRLGAPFDVYLTSDLHHHDFPGQYKLYVMMNTFYLSEADRRRIDELKKNGATFLWFYAPGYISDKGLDLRQIETMTGFKVESLPGKEKMCAVPTQHRLTEGLTEQYRLTSSAFSYKNTRQMHADEFGPKFRIVDSAAETAARFADGKTALAVKDFGTWKSIYSIIPRLERPVLRNICRLAGVHLYTEAEDIIFDANQNFIVLHNGYQGSQEIDLTFPRPADVSDALSGEKLGGKINQLKIQIEECSTRILYLEY